MLQARIVTTDRDVETLRAIRNSGRDWMTRDTSEITPAMQAAWWAARDPDRLIPYLFSVAQTDVGFGLVRSDGDRWWCSLAVLPVHRGQGYGPIIYRYLALSVAPDVWAEILADNRPSLRAALAAGFDIAGAHDKVATLVFRKA